MLSRMVLSKEKSTLHTGSVISYKSGATELCLYKVFVSSIAFSMVCPMMFNWVALKTYRSFSFKA